MFENDQKLWAAISSVINGNPTEEEKKLFYTWINESDANKMFFEIVNQQNEKKYDSSDNLKERIYTKIERSVLPGKKKRRINLWIPAAAASLFLILSLFSLVKSWKQPEMVFLESYTPNGVKTRLVLADSTIVYLNAGSYLKYPASFIDKTREVFLKGEAYFEVKKDTKHPFVVQTGDISIKVFGTQFNVRNYSTDENIETTLIIGSVGVYTKSGMDFHTQIALKPNEQAIYSKHEKDIKKRKVDAELYSLWKEGKYYFDNEPLSNVIVTLELNFNVKIKIHSKKLENKVFSGLFDKNKNITQILDGMKHYSNFKYTIKNDSINIYEK